ncbi:MAG: SDR family NAD(P)-dependent oxidoreductase [Acidobacteria bacterium]|nr:SDR family NAD(P)-dependent oxidoreductase [Acidobacteriota bacterium]
MGLLDGKIALITGGSRGIGRALCEVFAREGADIIFNYNSSDDLAREVVEKIQSMGRKAVSYKVSVTDRPAINKMVREIHHQFGRIDILVNNAAINRGDNFATMTEHSWHTVIDTNVNSLFNVTKPVFKLCCVSDRDIFSISAASARFEPCRPPCITRHPRPPSSASPNAFPARPLHSASLSTPSLPAFSTRIFLRPCPRECWKCINSGAPATGRDTLRNWRNSPPSWSPTETPI